MSERHIHQLRLVDDQFRAARAALQFAAVQSEATLVDSRYWAGVTRPHITRALGGLEETYLVRLFCEFEAMLRDHWTSFQKNPAEPNVNYLIDQALGTDARFAAMRTRVHDVQRTRNDIVHHRVGAAYPVTYEDARKHLSRYLLELPEDQR